MTISISKFAPAEILVIGDIMLDRYCIGSVERISPEAPVPVVKLEETSVRAGGAANVAANIAGLGSNPVLVGITGKDDDGRILPEVLRSSGIPNNRIYSLEDRSTTTKTRIIAHSQQVARMDQESDHDLDDAQTEMILGEIGPLLESADLIVLSDYAKGMLTPRLVAHVVNFARGNGKVVLVDPKGKNFEKYSGATIITPNEREAMAACGIDQNSEDAVDSAGKQLLGSLGLDALLITRGDKGMTLYEREGTVSTIEATARRVYDVTGAGDTAIATMATALGSGSSFREAARIANIAAGMVVEKLGTTPISASMLFSEYREAGTSLS